MTEPYVDPAHRVPDEEWAAVVRRAQELREAAEAAKTGGASSPAGRVIDMRGRSNKHSGVSGLPTQLLVLHSAECPLRGGYAQSLTEWAITSGVIASWQRFIDPISRVYMIDDMYAAWHASEANPMSIGWEQAGYARYSRAEWITPDGMLQMESLAYDMAEVAKRDGIPAVWLTTDQVNAITSGRDRTTKGLCTHRQIDPESRTDPGDGYPYELLLAKIKGYVGAAAIAPQSPKEDTLSAAEVREIKDHINMALYGGPPNKAQLAAPLWDVAVQNQSRIGKLATAVASGPAAVWATTISRAGKKIPALQELANIFTKVANVEPAVAQILQNTSADDIAASIPDDIAQQVVDALAERLAGGVK